jgi:hypothetical protein
MPAASEQISAGVAPIHFVGAAIQAAHCRLFAHRQPMSHRAPSRNEGRNLADGRFRYRQSSIFCRFAGQEHECAWLSDDDRSQWSAAHGLAVCAVANSRRFGIGFGLERHVAAVTASINFHDRFPGIPQTGMDDSYCPTGLIVRSGS